MLSIDLDAATEVQELSWRHLRRGTSEIVLWQSLSGRGKHHFHVAFGGVEDERRNVAAVVPIAQRPEIQVVIDEPEVRRKIELYVRGFVRRQHRSAKTQLIIRDAGHVDDSAAAVWQNLLDDGLTGMTMFGRHLRESGQLRAGLDPVEVSDVLWTFTAVEFYELLVPYRGWSLKRYAQWTAQAMIAALL